MSLDWNSCRCQCEKSSVRTQLIVILKDREAQNKESRQFTILPFKTSTMALQPKNFEIKMHNSFKRSCHQHRQNQNTQIFKCSNKEELASQLTKNIQESRTWKLSGQTTKSQSIDYSQMPFKEKILNFQTSEQQTQRKTLKKGKQFSAQIKENNVDLVLTTKRNKAQMNAKSPQLQKEIKIITTIQQKQDSHILIKQIPINPLEKNSFRKGFANTKGNSKLDSNPQLSLRLLNDEVSLLRDQLKRLQQDEKRLQQYKQNNERFFEQDYKINQMKKQNLQKSCQMRYEQIKDLKRLIKQCKERGF